MSEPSTDYSGFDVKAPAASSTLTAVDIELQRFLYNVLPTLHADQLRMVRGAVVTKLADVDPEGEGQAPQGQLYGPDYDIKLEVDGLIQAVRAMQGSVMVNGKIRDGITPKEMREVVQSTTSLMTLLMRAHEKLLSLDRVRCIEQATISVLRDLGDDALVERFVSHLEQELSTTT